VFERNGIKMKAYVAVQSKLLRILCVLWKKEQCFEENFGISGIQEPKTLFSVAPTGAEKEIAEPKGSAKLDGHPCNQSSGALVSVM
jgi:hypothetical protein